MSEWKQHIFATHEERQGTSIGPWPGDRYPGVALPSRKALKKWVVLRVGPLWTCACVHDVGPWTIDDDDYVFGNERPRAEILKGKVIYTTRDGYQSATVAGRPVRISNGAGIDLFPATAIALKIPLMNNVNVDWKFIEPPF